MTNPLTKTENRLAVQDALRRKVEQRGINMDKLAAEFAELTGESLTTKAVDICLSSFISQDPRITTIKDQIRKLAPTDLPVLIVGESGVGKELLARALHGDRPQGRFIDVNCAGIPDTLLESEFFGAEKGSYTGCDKSRYGYLYEASGGTLFLDEIGEMPFLLQAKLLRVIQEKEARYLGGTANYKVSCRFVSATNRSVEELRDNKNLFRQDLFYRLAGHIITVPSLNDRRPDIKLITETLGYKWDNYLEAKTNREHSIPFPGNVRELLNLLESRRILGLEC